MKIIPPVFLLLLGCFQPSFSQTFHQPSIADAMMRRNDDCANWQTLPGGALTVINATTWTWNSQGCGQGDTRAYIKFDLNPAVTPQALYDNRATMNLYFPTGYIFKTEYKGTATDNMMYMQRVTAAWDEMTMTWDNQATTTTTGQVTILSSVPGPSEQDYSFDVSAFVYDWICGGLPNYGVRFILINEGQLYRNVSIASREFADVSKHPELILEYAYIDALAPDTVCSGAQVPLTCSLTNAANPAGYSYHWLHVNSGTTYSTQNVANAQAVNGLNTYIVTVSNPWCQTATDTVNVFMNTVAGSVVTLSPAADTVCNGNPLTLTAAGAVSYAWNTGTSTTNTLLINPTTTTTYVVTGTDAAGCTSSAQAIIDVYPAPVLDFSLVPDSCMLGIGAASVNIISGTGPYNFVWNSNPQQTGDTADSLIAGVYTVSVTDGNGCITTDSVEVLSVNGLPVSTVITDEHCDMMDGIIEIVSDSGLTYTWQHDNSLSLPIADGLTSGTYTVTISDGQCMVVVDAVVGAWEGPVAGFHPTATVVTTEFGNIVFIDQSVNALTWMYDFGDGNSVSFQNPEHHFYNSGSYTVIQTVTDEFGCIDTASAVIEVNDAFNFFIPSAFSPNGDGINDYFHVYGSGFDVDRFIMEIFDRWGRMVFYSTDINHPWDGERWKAESPDEIRQGVYTYRIMVVSGGNKIEKIGKVVVLP